MEFILIVRTILELLKAINKFAKSDEGNELVNDVREARKELLEFVKSLGD